MSSNVYSNQIDSIVDRLPPYVPIRVINSVDRYGFSTVLAKRCGRYRVPRSFANWVHGWVWADEPTAELLACSKLPQGLTIVVRHESEKFALEREGFTDVHVGGLPFSYVVPQHTKRFSEKLLAFPPHSAEAERVTADQRDYLDYLETLKNDFDSIYLSVYYLDIHGPIHKAAQTRGLHVIQGARPDDANSLVRIRSLLDSFAYVTSNVMGSHMLYSLYAGCRFSFCGPIYGYKESEFLANGNPHGHSSKYVELALKLQSEDFLRHRFGKFFCDSPRNGVQDQIFAKNTIGEKYVFDQRRIEDVLGWGTLDQIKGYVTGAKRRLIRLALFNVV